MIPLLGVSLVATTLIVERLWFWGRLIRRQRPLIRAVIESYSYSPEPALVKLQQHRDLPAARIFLAALTLSEATPEEFRLALESAAQAELPILKRFSTVLDTIVGIAPLLGLLGTVLGLIQSLGAFQPGAIDSDRALGVTVGIGDALISTAAGLTVAIVTLVFANLFQGLYRRQRAFIQESGGQLELIYRRRQRQGLPLPRDQR
ncbi:MotA/TolQ/ExbB proton channel family protein [Leptolyngbya sp. PCC 6406]|uniref:MotA/TolQ/ExbB proton channel family protein n=1 Tax=Leptolyngbya sp. PCC 6406 TaxID=1173264 RepID=UPI001CEDEF11|nr:MotA/TolQ/ExbB proton channel family protein [Leptolyngbya sp. PCC 6406]